MVQNNYNRTEEPHPRTRKIITSAIHVESAIIDFPFRCNKRMNSARQVTKRCSCAISNKNCPCHGSLKTAESSSSETLKNVDSSKEILLKQWLAKKEQEKKNRELQEKIQQETKQKERQQLLEVERQNFKTWLENKRKVKQKHLKEKQKQIEVEQLQESEKEKRQLENQLRFKLWLKRKEQMNIEKKINEHKKFIGALEEKNQREERNKQAYNEWLKNSKYKQKPIPLNQGLRSLHSSSSVSYINPTPWNPNIDEMTIN